nr:hypothetical protein HmN_000541200 [Hymenolepis microstoma]
MYLTLRTVFQCERSSIGTFGYHRQDSSLIHLVENKTLTWLNQGVTFVIEHSGTRGTVLIPLSPSPAVPLIALGNVCGRERRDPSANQQPMVTAWSAYPKL